MLLLYTCLFLCLLGLFLNVLFDKLESMLSNGVFVNLHLTGLFSRLAVYSHPLLRTYLLNYKLVLQPNVRSLFQVTYNYISVSYLLRSNCNCYSCRYLAH